jgi:integrase
LEWADLDLAAGVLHVRAQLVVQKGAQPQRGPLKSSNSRRTIPLAAQALVALQALRVGAPTDAGWIFKTSAGTPYSARNINRAWGQAVTNAALPRIRLHDARHTAVSLLLASGLDRYSVARHAGHTVATMEGTYTHVLPKQAQAVADTMTRLLQSAGDKP